LPSSGHGWGHAFLRACGPCSDPVTVELQEGQHRDEREALVAVYERLSLGDPVGEHRRLEGKIGLLIVRVARRPAKRAINRRRTAQLISSLWAVAPMIAAKISSASSRSR
jgi:hypothetical protein